MDNKNILISGAGIAGLALAYWLKKHGFKPTVVEFAPKLREGGYAIDFFGAGFDVAEKMGILSDLEKVDLRIKEVVFVDEQNRKRGALNAFQIRGLVNGRFYNVLRSDLARVISGHLDSGIEFIFGDTITKIEQTRNEVMVSFQSGNERIFDLVVGADGLHSNVRNLVFSDESQYEKYFEFYVAAYTILDHRKSFEKDSLFKTYTVPGKQVNTYSTKGDKLTSLFIWSSAEKYAYEHSDVMRQKQILRNEFRNVGWECPTLLEGLDKADDFYFDPISQIKMDHWSNGRVTLVGDACDCPSLLSGQGSTLAMVAAYILAGELKESTGDYKIAFRQYENIFKPFIDKKQKLAKLFAVSYIPKNNFGIWMRNTLTGIIFSSLVSKWFVSKFMRDRINIKEY